MQVELKGCPFCGGKAKRMTIGDDEPNNAGGDVIVCTRCQASSHVEFGRKENLVDRWNTRFEASLVDRDALIRVRKMLFDEHDPMLAVVAYIDEALATPSVLAESTSNDCLLVAEAVRERCVEAAEKLVRFDRKNGDEQQRARADAFQAGQRHAVQEIRSLDLSGVGVG